MQSLIGLVVVDDAKSHRFQLDRDILFVNHLERERERERERVRGLKLKQVIKIEKLGQINISKQRMAVKLHQISLKVAMEGGDVNLF